VVKVDILDVLALKDKPLLSLGIALLYIMAYIIMPMYEPLLMCCCDVYLGEPHVAIFAVLAHCLLMFHEYEVKVCLCVAPADVRQRCHDNVIETREQLSRNTWVVIGNAA
jgi:hypothetical protein